MAAAGLSKSGSSFSANIIKIVHLFIRKFCSSFSRKCSSLLYVWMNEWMNKPSTKYIKLDGGNVEIRLNWNNECGVKLCEIYDEGCSSLSFDYTCKIRDGTELEMETQSDTRHNLKTTPTPTPTVSLHCEKLPPPCHLFITKKKKNV